MYNNSLLIKFTFGIWCVLMLLQGGSCRASVTGSYATQQTTWIGFLRITQTGNKLTGYIQYVFADMTNLTTTQRSDVHGSVSGHNITLKLDSFLGYGGKQADGTVHDGTIILEFPNNTGRIEKFTFTSMTSTTWNQKVEAFELKWSRTFDAQRRNQQRQSQVNTITQDAKNRFLEVFDSMKKIAGYLDALDLAQEKVKQAIQDVEERKKIVTDVEETATRAEQEATTGKERFQAGKLRYEAGKRKYEQGTAESALNTGKLHLGQLLDAIDSEKHRLSGTVAKVRHLQSDALKIGIGSTSPSLPDLGKYVAITIAPSTKVRAKRESNSDIVREVSQGSHLGVGALYGDDCSVILPTGQMGFVPKSDLRLIKMDEIGRQTLGVLGIITVLEAPITKTKLADGELLTTVKRDNYVCITGEQDGYFGVQLQNGSRGWIKREDVRLLAFQVTRDENGNLVSPGMRR